MELTYDREGHAFGEIDGVKFEGFCVPVTSQYLIFIKAGNLFLGCGFFSMDTFDKIGIPAARITCVSSIEQMLNSNIVSVTKSAAAHGITECMTGAEAIAKMKSA
ncbi:MAG: YunC family protein [Methanocorpusculum sp.]|nr:YunC family protein [Methanocorpusculum sp.]